MGRARKKVGGGVRRGHVKLADVEGLDCLSSAPYTPSVHTLCGLLFNPRSHLRRPLPPSLPIPQTLQNLQGRVSPEGRGNACLVEGGGLGQVIGGGVDRLGGGQHLG